MLNLIRINKLEELIKYEDPKTSNVRNGDKKWTKGVPIVLVDKDNNILAINEWVYINNHGGELVYNKRKNLWCQGSEWYDKGKSHIRDVYILSHD
ncbi:hypothetical protein [Bacillus altitudinis]|uniref:hypothetical protein n=1 Tax=Bacillus altitudinis TaxID=293387 RepID=UPI002FFFB408